LGGQKRKTGRAVSQVNQIGNPLRKETDPKELWIQRKQRRGNIVGLGK